MDVTKRTNVTRLARNTGFTLTELLVTIAIIAILSMVAFPSFVQSVRKSNRTDAFTALTRASNNLERFFSTNGTYTTDTTQLGFTLDGGTAYSDSGHYVMTVTAGTTGIGSSYVVNAVATAGDMQVNDEGCSTLTLDSLGRRIPDPVASRCW